MHIPENLPQFEDGSAIVAICGSKTGKVFLGKNGELTELFFVDHEEIKYSDKEGFFMGEVGGGSPKDLVSDEEERAFLEKFAPAIAEMVDREGPERIYLFAPSESAPKIIGSLRESDRSRVVVAKEGNYVDRHPTEVLGYMTEV